MREIEGPSYSWCGTMPTTTTTRKALESMTARSYDRAITTHEALIGDNNLRPVSFLSAGIRLARSVVQVIIPGFGLGTGFMVSHDCVLTNNHVLPSAGHAERALIRFNYETDFYGKILPSYYYKLLPNRLFVTDKELDFSIVAVEDNPGTNWGVIPLVSVSFGIGQRVNIIQHPAGGPKQIALVDNQLVYADKMVAQYLTDTLPGSSGSPVFNDEWQLIALHHSGGWIPEPSSASTHFRNEGIRISAILERLKEKRLI